jgi:hypothetical protein
VNHTAFDELCDVANRHHLAMNIIADRIPGEPVVGSDGRLYRNDTAGDLHVRIDLRASV